MHLRDYESADAAATLDVFRRAVRGTASRDYSPEQVRAWAPDDVDVARWAARRAAARTQVAEHEGRVVGFTDVDAEGYVDMLFVDPGVVRQGVASALLGWVAATARSDGATELTTHASVTARPFFEARGFVVVAERRPVLRGVEMVNYAMRRPLDPPA
ncbi:GNAT family N-acetyltransferase [Cellulosimicrobium marinum]|uniref:GNAT family N-acetyltransferase n=1 Tax=Cellulosimicrobium marinum TaxID=1638992 RepID=UPI001E4B3E27|nr:GNAT family N-acetyltransferase [Cellulosimicrobium marinum]MCB7137304.1 GNAT family N-acetyltransferase [Cellulosimicrobium marinum]